MGEYRSFGIDGELVLARGELPLVKVVDLKRALTSRAADYDTESATSLVSQLPDDYLDTDGPYEDVWFELADGQLLVGARFFEDYPDDERAHLGALRGLLAPFLATERATLTRLEIDDYLSNGPFAGISLSIAVPWAGRTAEHLYRVGEKAILLSKMLSSGAVGPESALSLIMGGAADALVGQPESSWLEAKSDEYDLQTLHGRLRISQAVAKFCNSEDGGLIVIGAKTKKVPGGEIIQSVRGIRADAPGIETRYLRVLDQHLYPLPVHLGIHTVPVGDGRILLVLNLPPQPDHLKPFLVWGAMTPGGQVEGAFISIVQRRGEGSVPTTGPMIHAALSAGRALLRAAASNEPTARRS